MRAICACPPLTGTGMWNFSTGWFGLVTSMIIVPLNSTTPPLSGFGFEPPWVPTKAIVLPSG